MYRSETAMTFEEDKVVGKVSAFLDGEIFNEIVVQRLAADCVGVCWKRLDKSYINFKISIL